MPLTRRLFTAAAIALAGAFVMLAMLWPSFIDALPMTLFAGAGALLPGLVFAPLFGRPGRTGIALAAFGAVSATLVGAGLGGLSFGLLAGVSIEGLWAGPILVAQAIAMTPSVLLVWVATMSAVHLAAIRWARRPAMPS